MEENIGEGKPCVIWDIDFNDPRSIQYSSWLSKKRIDARQILFEHAWKRLTDEEAIMQLKKLFYSSESTMEEVEMLFPFKRQKLK